MSKDKISDYSATANSNTDIGGINIDEGCAPSGINDAIRTLMKQLKDWQSGSQDVYIHPAGSASVPSITATGDTNTGIFFPAADTVGITTGGTERARFDSSGNMGLGVTPSAWGSGFKAFENQGGALYSGSPNAILLGNNFYYNGTNNIYKNANLASAYSQNAGVHAWYYAASGTAGNAITFTQAMTLDASGNLGIGTTSPADKLHIVGGNGFVNNAQGFGARNSAANGTAALFGAAGRVDYGTSGNNAVISVASGNNILFGTLSNTEYARIDSSGNLGVGATSPAFGSGSGIEIERSGTATLRLERTSSSAAVVELKADSGAGVLETRDANPLIFGTSATERARIDTSGNLLVGTTSVGSYGSGIVVGNSSSAKAVTLPVNGGGATFNGIDTVNNPTAGFTTGHITTTSQYAVRVGSTGGLQLSGAGATSWTALSDETTKDIIEPISNAANKVCQLRAVIGKYKTDEEGVRRSFLMAQDVQAVLPEAVSVIKKELGSEETALGLAYTDVIPLLVAAIKEQQAIITQLQADVAALKGQA